MESTEDPAGAAKSRARPAFWHKRLSGPLTLSLHPLALTANGQVLVRELSHRLGPARVAPASMSLRDRLLTAEQPGNHEHDEGAAPERAAAPPKKA